MIVSVPKFYLNADDIKRVVSDLNFVEMQYGLEVENFYMIPEGVLEGFSTVLSRPLMFTPDSGRFRLPYPVVHFEAPQPHMILCAAVAMEDTVFRTHRHKPTDSISAVEVEGNMGAFIADNCFDASKWEAMTTVVMRPNDLVVFSPLLWHSFEKNLIKWFGLVKADA